MWKRLHCGAAGRALAICEPARSLQPASTCLFPLQPKLTGDQSQGHLRLLHGVELNTFGSLKKRCAWRYARGG